MVVSRSEHVFLNGRIVPAGRAVVSVFDRGLLYGDGLFETLRAYRGGVFALDRHLQRLGLSAAMLGIPVRVSTGRRSSRACSNATGCSAPTPGCVSRSRAARRSPACSPGRAGTDDDPDGPARRPPAAGVAAARRGGDHAAVRARQFPCRAQDPPLPARRAGQRLGPAARAHEGLYALPDGTLREGTTSSLFVLRSGVLCTPPGRGILPGITREMVLRLADAAGLRAKETELRVNDLYRSEEAFLGASVSELIPIVRADGKPIGTGRPGPVTRRLQRLYRAHVESQCAPCGAPRRSTDSKRRAARK